MTRILICDLIGLLPGDDGKPDSRAVADHIRARGAEFVMGPAGAGADNPKDAVTFYYQPDLASEADLLAACGEGLYDGVIAAATVIPEAAKFALGGVRIGAGTGNMRAASWGGGSGRGGAAVLMNTPGSNSIATAQMVMKALLDALPAMPMAEIHDMVLAGQFDTGRDLIRFPVEKLEGMSIAVLGFGNIGAAVARLAAAFGMQVCVYARPAHRARIEAAGYRYAASPVEAAVGAKVLSVHLGLGPLGADGRYANQEIIGADVLSGLRSGAIVINYDRGEILDVAALEAAMSPPAGAIAGVARAYVDADIFLDSHGRPFGPLVPYLEPARRLGGRLRLLPHMAADTDHPSRVAGAMRAVDQIMDMIRSGRVRNLVGDLPPGYQLAE